MADARAILAAGGHATLVAYDALAEASAEFAVHDDGVCAVLCNLDTAAVARAVELAAAGGWRDTRTIGVQPWWVPALQREFVAYRWQPPERAVFEQKYGLPGDVLRVADGPYAGREYRWTLRNDLVCGCRTWSHQDGAVAAAAPESAGAGPSPADLADALADDYARAQADADDLARQFIDAATANAGFEGYTDVAATLRRAALEALRRLGALELRAPLEWHEGCHCHGTANHVVVAGATPEALVAAAREAHPHLDAGELRDAAWSVELDPAERAALGAAFGKAKGGRG